MEPLATILDMSASEKSLWQQGGGWIRCGQDWTELEDCNNSGGKNVVLN